MSASFCPQLEPPVLVQDRPGATSGPSTLSLRRNFSWSLLGNVTYAGCQWGMLMVLAKLGSPEKVGQFALALAVTAPIMLLSSLKLRSVQATDVRGEYRFGDYLGLRLLTTPLAMLVIAGACLAAGYPLGTTMTIMAVGLAKALESISDVYHGYFQSHERMDRIAASMVLKGVTALAAFGVGVSATGDLLWGALGMAGAWGVVLVGYDIPVAAALARGAAGDRLRPRWSAGPLARLARATLPLGFVIMIGSLNTNIPRYAIERELGDRELGIFSAMAYLLVAGSLVINALGQSASPRLANYYANGRYGSFRALLLKLVILGASLGLAGTALALAAGRPILSALYTAEYAQAHSTLVLICFCALINYSCVFIGTSVCAMRLFRVQLPIALLTLAVLAIGVPPLVRSLGLDGAAIALIIAGIVEFMAYMLVLSRVLNGTKVPESER